MSIEELAKYLSVAEKTIRKWVLNEDIPYRKIHKVIRFRLSEVERWIESGGKLPLVNEEAGEGADGAALEAGSDRETCAACEVVADSETRAACDLFPDEKNGSAVPAVADEASAVEAVAGDGATVPAVAGDGASAVGGKE